MNLPILITLLAASALFASDTAIEPMPAKLETDYALSAAPPALRAKATVYLLDPAKGYQISRQGTNGVACLVECTAWERADFRNDIYVPLCYDSAGDSTYLKVIRDVAAMRIEGLSPSALKSEIEKRYRNKTYQPPSKPGLSYMIAPVMRTWMMPDWNVHTMPMPHLMFYAPNLTDAEIGADPAASVQYPFAFKEGIAEQTYMIQILGESEQAKIISSEATLLMDLCTYRNVLCVPHKVH